MQLMNSRSIHSDSLRGYLRAMEAALCHKEMSDQFHRAEGYLTCLLNTGLIDPAQRRQVAELLTQTRAAWRAAQLPAPRS